MVFVVEVFVVEVFQCRHIKHMNMEFRIFYMHPLSLAGRVTLPSTMREVIQVVRDVVARQQKSVIWEMEGNQMGSAMDLST